MLVLAGCVSEPPRELTAACDDTDECESGLTCVAGRCTVACTASPAANDCLAFKPTTSGWETYCGEGWCEMLCDAYSTLPQQICPDHSKCVPGPETFRYHCVPAP
jgi:hypothetical protein